MDKTKDVLRIEPDIAKDIRDYCAVKGLVMYIFGSKLLREALKVRKQADEYARKEGEVGFGRGVQK